MNTPSCYKAWVFIIGWYVSMKKIAVLLVIMILAPLEANALKCQNRIDATNWHPPIIEKSTWDGKLVEYLITVPSSVRGLRIVHQFIHEVDENGVLVESIVAPIAFKITGDSTESKVILNAKYADYKFQAQYGGECGPRIWHSFE